MSAKSHLPFISFRRVGNILGWAGAGAGLVGFLFSIVSPIVPSVCGMGLDFGDIIFGYGRVLWSSLEAWIGWIFLLNPRIGTVGISQI